MSRRIFASICTVALLGALLLSVCVVALAYNEAGTETYTRLRQNAYYMAEGLETEGMAYLERVRGYAGRTTLIAPDGTVLFDDREDPANMENHASRPEVQAALDTGAGQAARQSSTVGVRTLYYAVRLPDGNVLRLAATANDVWAEALRFVPWLLALCAVMVLLAALAARRQTKAIVEPMNRVDLDRPLDGTSYPELTPFLRRIAAQKEQLAAQMEQLRYRTLEFATLTDNMNEGLLIVNAEGQILSVNCSARRILDLPEDQPTGGAVVLVCRDLTLDAAVKQAVAGQRAEAYLELDGRTYRLAASPVLQADAVLGAVVLLTDDTEKLAAESRRREFAANVSHELKTPLTSISGYAEIIRNGMVKPEDIADFAGRIYDESTRLVKLVGDIINLSRLDEKDTGLPFAPVDLLAVAKQAADHLAGVAAERQVEVLVKGQPVVVSGVPSVLAEVLTNLVENAVRYNHEGGRVTISVGMEGDEATVQVEDTGVGIPPAQQAQVFERFYRVDKSHARDSGGTGLGLAIAKRGVLLHGGTISLTSAPGKGSVFAVRLPLAPPEA